MAKKKQTRIKFPKGPCDPSPPKRPPFPRPTPPWDKKGGPSLSDLFRIGKKK